MLCTARTALPHYSYDRNSIPATAKNSNCLICYEDIHWLNSSFGDKPLVCSNQTEPSEQEGLPTATAHHHCIDRMYRRWQGAQSDMRLPHCPHCLGVLNENLTIQFLSINELITKYQRLNRSSHLSQKKEHKAYVVKAIIALIKSDASSCQAMLKSENLPILVKHYPLDDPHLDQTLRQGVSDLTLQRKQELLLTLLCILYTKKPTEKTVLASQILMGAAECTPQDSTPNLNQRADMIMKLAEKKLYIRSSNFFVQTYINNALHGMSLEEMAQLGLQFKLLNFSSYEQTHHSIPQGYGLIIHQSPYSQCHRLLMMGFEYKLDHLKQYPDREKYQILEHCQKLRKFNCEDIQQLSQQYWNQYAKDQDTRKVCASVLLEKYYKRKNLSAFDTLSLIQSLKAIMGDGFEHKNEVSPLLLGVLAIPPRKPMAKYHLLLHSKTYFEQVKMRHTLRQFIEPMVHSLSEQRQLSETEIEALKYIHKHGTESEIKAAQQTLEIFGDKPFRAADNEIHRWFPSINCQLNTGSSFINNQAEIHETTQC